MTWECQQCGEQWLANPGMDHAAHSKYCDPSVGCNPSYCPAQCGPIMEIGDDAP